MAAADLLVLDPTGVRARLLLAARAAPVAVAAFLASLLTYALLLPMAPAYAPLGDAASLVLALALAGMAAGLAELTWEHAKRITSGVATFGVIVALGAAALNAAELAGAGPALIPGVSLAFAALGAWLLAANALCLALHGLPRWAALLGMLAGAGFLVGALFADIEGPGRVALAVAGVLSVAGFPAWALGARRALLRAAAEAGIGRGRNTGVNA